MDREWTPFSTPTFLSRPACSFRSSSSFFPIFLSHPFDPATLQTRKIPFPFPTLLDSYLPRPLGTFYLNPKETWVQGSTNRVWRAKTSDVRPDWIGGPCRPCRGSGFYEHPHVLYKKKENFSLAPCLGLESNFCYELLYYNYLNGNMVTSTFYSKNLK